MAPPGRQKSEREFCLFGGIFLRLACRAVCRGWLFLRGLPFLRRLLCPVFRHFSAGVPLSCPRLAGSLLLLRLVWPVLPGPACRLPAVRFVCAGLLLPLFGLFGLLRRGGREVPPPGGCA